MASLLAPASAITVYRGASKTLGLSVVKSGVVDSEGNPVPVILTPGQVRLLFSVKCEANDQPAKIQKTTDNAAQIEITHPTGGKARIYLLPEDTQYLDPGVYTFDVWLYYVLTGQRYVIVKPSTFEILMPVSYSPL